MKAILYSKKYQSWLRFSQPLMVLTAETPDRVPEIIARCEQANKSQGLWAVGFVSYEAAGGFDSALTVRDNSSGLPYAVFGLYDEPEFCKHLPHVTAGTEADIDWTAEIDKSRYLADLEHIRKRLNDGDTYQVNYTFRLNGNYSESALELFYRLVQAQPTDYAGYLELDNYAVCSISPELFFSRRGNIITSRPMKGTAPRGLDSARDRIIADELFSSQKARAENVMIVDMIRNDLGRIAQPGTVDVPHLFTLEQYPTLWQMTSTVTCKSDASLVDIFRALFPCASITGAPKRAAMDIIAALEVSPRGVYCGSVGLIDVDGDCSFNVAIRTVVIDKSHNIATYGSGGGIVWDSCPHNEFEEACLKAQLLTQPVLSDFSLLETLAWFPHDGYYLLSEHIERMKESARYFGYIFEPEILISQLESLARTLAGPTRLRLLADKQGQIEIQTFALEATAQTPAKVILAKNPVDCANVFLYHKTTCRDVYNNAAKDNPGFDDVILYNQNNEITESTIANIVVEFAGKKYTPPVSSGLLPGVYRQHLLAAGEITEKVITIDDMLRSADAIYLINSVRKWRKAILC